MSDLAGKVLEGKYRLIRLIGKGGMGAVYEAEHTIISRKMAVKLLHKELTDSSAVTERFVREAKSASAIGHPNIIDIQDVGKTDEGQTFIVMELLKGKSLTALIQSAGRLPVERAANLTLQILSALEAAHQKGIIHRDLKPDNIFLTFDERLGEQVKILDFGISKVKGPSEELGLTRTGQVMGTPFYMAPEQARGAKDIDERIDIWAVGVILYQMLTGQVPFPGESYNEVLSRILTEPPRPVAEATSGIPEPVTKVLDKALAKDRLDRFSTASEFVEALTPFVGETEVLRRSDPDHALMETVAAPAGPPSVATAPVSEIAKTDPLGATGPASGADKAEGAEANGQERPEAESDTQPEDEPDAPLWKSILWFGVTAVLCWVPILLTAGAPKAVLLAFGLPRTLPAALAFVIVAAICGGMTFASVVLYWFWRNGRWNNWLQGPGFLLFPAVGLALVLYHYLTLRGQQQSHLQSLRAYGAITEAQASRISSMLARSTAGFLNSTVFDLLFVLLLATVVLLAYLFVKPKGTQPAGPKTRWVVLPAGVVVILLFEVVLFPRQLGEMGPLHFGFYLLWILTSVAMLRMNQPRVGDRSPAWRALAAGLVAAVAMIGAHNTAGYVVVLKGLARLNLAPADREWVYAEVVNPAMLYGTMVEWLLLFVLFAAVAVACRRVLTLRPVNLRAIAGTAALVVVTAVPTVVVFSAMLDVTNTWLPRKVSKMQPAALRPGAPASFYIDKTPQALWEGRKALHEYLTKKPRLFKKEQDLKPALRGYTACPKILSAALEPKKPRRPARCVTAIEARLYCKGRGMRLPSPEEWEGALKTVPVTADGTMAEGQPLARGPFAEWTMRMVHGTATFELRGTDAAPDIPPKLEPNQFHEKVGFRCVFSFEK